MLQSHKIMENERKDAEAPKQGEDLLTKTIGAIGKWQIWICFVVFLVKFPVAWHQMSIIFLAPPMNFTCADNHSAGEFDNVCHENCTDYMYDHNIFHETIISQWNLVCDRAWLKNLTQTIFMLGILVGNMVFGHLSDRYGRRIPFLGAVFLQLISGVTTAYSVNWYMFTALRFLLAVATGGTMVTSFVLTMELIGAKYRDTVGIIYQIPFNLGHLSLPVFGYFLRDWNMFQLAISLPSVLFLSYYFLLPESPRWLLTAGKTEEAAKIMEIAAKRNNRPVDNIEAIVDQARNEMIKNNQQQTGSYQDLFKTPKVRFYTCVTSFIWMFCSLIFFGVNQYIGQLQGNLYLNVMISAACLVPAVGLVVLGTIYLKRRTTILTSFSIAGVSLLVFIFVEQRTLILAFAIIGQIGAYSSFILVYLFTSEVFPTIVRNSALGFASMFGRCGGFVAPFVVNIGIEWVSIIVFSILAFASALLCRLLPETKDITLLNTIEQTEKCDDDIEPQIVPKVQ
ncbi:hypothetical protein evm_001432 [Chilo suppressalis]|nr:hypothetical protein evm_001432 [Chilo suppressalis]